MTTLYRAGEIFPGSWWSSDRRDCEYYGLETARPLYEVTVPNTEIAAGVEQELMDDFGIDDMSTGDMPGFTAALRKINPAAIFCDVSDHEEGSHILLRDIHLQPRQIGIVAGTA